MNYERRLGEAESTFVNKKTAIKAFNFQQTLRNCPTIEAITEEDAESDNLQHIISRWALWLASTPIPTYHDDNFKPRFSGNVQAIEYMTVSSKVKYFERVKEVLKDKFGTHSDWTNESTWYKPLKDNFTKECKQRSLRNDANDAGDRQIRPLYKMNFPNTIRMSRGLEGNDFQSLTQIDLNFICKKVCVLLIFYLSSYFNSHGSIFNCIFLVD